MLSCRAAIIHGHAGEDQFISWTVGLRLTTAVTASVTTRVASVTTSSLFGIYHSGCLSSLLFVTTRAWMGTDNLKLKHPRVYKPRISP